MVASRGTTMRKSINLNILYPSILITILLAYVIPCRFVEDWKKVFGFPFGWFTVFHDKIGNVILKSTAVNIIPLLLDTVIIYLFLLLVCSLYRKKKIS